MLSVYTDDYFMQLAVKEAQKAAENGEIPVGAIIVCNQQIIAKAYNQTQLLNDITAHAEIMAITTAASYLGSKYLDHCTLYVTLEPCVMCAGALYWSQIARVVYGASDEKRGFMRYGKELLHPSTKLEYGIRHDECARLITSFFEKLRR
ncbi:MAG: nucleoside deaminase [Saprospiraceae bacterium]|nr:MAG: CMP/dCMP deaminase zinc-binding protein [Bacteroidetes bacterium OLB9]MCO6464343.1 nucleoside deaminase [Saprospiraceae bacterium]MCZ2337236.1 nucleoside deaminase [Chitinophagales bacterium]